MEDLQLNSKGFFQHVYQPIYNLSNFTICGYEAFLRPYGSGKNIEGLFLKAKKVNQLYDLDIKSIENAINVYFKQGYSLPNLFLNVFPSTLLKSSFIPFFEQILAKSDIQPNRIILEINEAEEIQDLQHLKNKIEFLQNMGVMMAIDDFGKGLTTIKSVLELEPDYIKLDQYFSKDLSYSIKKQKMVKTLVSHFKEDAKIILEGIEQPEDLAMAKLLGVPFGQGYLLGKPDYLSIDKKHFHNIFQRKGVYI